MKKVVSNAGAVLEWSPDSATVLNLESRQSASGAKLSDAAIVLNGQRTAIAAISRRATFVRTTRVPNTSRDEVARIIELRIADLFPLGGGELAYDFRLTDDVNEDGRLAIVTAVRESDLKQLYADAASAGIRVERVVPSALGAAMTAKQLGVEECAVVQQTPEGLAVDLIHQGELRYSRVTSIGETSSPEAEVKRTFMAAGLNPSQVVAPEGLVPYSVQGPVSTLGALAESDLAIHIETNETIQARIRKREQSRIRFSVLMALAAGLLATLVYLDRSDAQAAIAKVDAQNNTKLNKLRSIRTAAQTKSAELAKIQRTLEQGFKPAQKLSDVLAVVTNAAPEGVWLTGFTLERGKPMTTRGSATDSDKLADLLQNLGNEPRFRDVKLLFANNSTIGDKSVVEFSLTAFPIGNLPLYDVVKKKPVKK